MLIETANGVRKLKLFLRDGKVSSVSVDMGKVEYKTKKVPVITDETELINKPIYIDDHKYDVTCLSIGNAHCVIFLNSIDALNLENIGPKFEYSDIFPDRTNVEFVRVVNSETLSVRVWERGNGETQACGTGACAAVAAAVENGYCVNNTDVAVQLKGGEVFVNYNNGRVTMSGGASYVFEGTFEY